MGCGVSAILVALALFLGRCSGNSPSSTGETLAPPRPPSSAPTDVPLLDILAPSKPKQCQAGGVTRNVHDTAMLNDTPVKCVEFPSGDVGWMTIENDP